MSWKVVESVMRHSKSHATERLVLMVLATHAGEKTHECSCSYQMIYQQANISERTLIYSIKKLEALGEISVIRGTGRGNLTRYKINLPFYERVHTPASFIPAENKKKSSEPTDADAEERMQASAPFINADSEEKGCNPELKRMQASAPFLDTDSDEKGCNPELERVQTSAPFERVQASAPFPEKGCNSDPERVQGSAEKGARFVGAYKEVEPEETNSMEPDISGAGAPQTKRRRKPAPSKPGEGKTREADPCYETFCSAFEREYSAPYQHRTADFVQLTALRKTCSGKDWDLTADRWAKGITNYFASDLGNHTLADLASRFSAFYRSPLDRFGKPIAPVNGNGGGRGHPSGAGMLIDPNTLSPKTRGNAAALQSFIERRRK